MHHADSFEEHKDVIKINQYIYLFVVGVSLIQN